MKLRIVFGLLLLLCLRSQAQEMAYDDKDFACITLAQAQKYVSDFNIDVRSFGGMELCNPNVDTKKLFNDLQIIEKGQFSTTGNNNLIKGFVAGDQYYTWMKSETSGMERGNDVPYATAYNSGGYFTMQDGWASMSTLGRVGTVIHEARHTEGYRHYPCNQGTYAGSGLSGCDTDYSTGGSHAVEMEYYARVSVQGQNFHPVYKSMARLMAVARANFVFNSSPLKKREAVVALESQSGKAVLIDQGTQFVREAPSVPGFLKRTSYGAAIFDGHQALAIEMYDVTGSNPSLSDSYSYLKLLDNKTIYKDFEEFDVGVKRFVVGVDQQNRWSSYNFPNGRWNTAQATNLNFVKSATRLEDGSTGYFLISDQNKIYQVDAQSQRLTETGKNWNPKVINIISFDGSTLLLKDDGVVYRANGQPWEKSTTSYSQIINVPLYDSFEVKK